MEIFVLFLFFIAFPLGIHGSSSREYLPFKYDQAVFANNLDTFRQAPFPSPHYEEITKGVGPLDGQGRWSSKVALFGPRMFPIASDGETVLIAGGVYGKGRVILGGEEMYFLSGNPDPGLTKLTQNAVKWLAQKNTTEGINLQVWTIGSVGDLPFTRNRVSVGKLDVNTANVYYLPMRSSISQGDKQKLLSYVENGGGLMMAGNLNGWFNGHGGEENSLQHEGNSVIKTFGALIGKNAGIVKQVSSDPNLSLLNALTTLGSNDSTTKDVATSTTITMASIVLNDDSNKDPDFGEIFAKAASAFNSLTQGSDKASYCRMVQVLIRSILLTKPDKITKAEDHVQFPGSVPDEAGRIDTTESINGTYLGYPSGFGFSQAGKALLVSVGLYAPAGEVLKINIEEPSTLPPNHGIGIQIGSHTDSLYHKPSAPRSPQIVTSFKVSSEPITYVANPWGGLVYVQIPYGASLPVFKITIRGAVKAPHFVLGKTTVDEWKSTIRNYPGPFGELEVPDQFIMTVGSSELRTFDDPEGILKLYKDAMQVYNYMQGFEGSFRFRAERITLDAEISAGLMHSGYPIMGYQRYAKSLISEEAVRAGQLWGPFHELGHNAQWNQYTIGSTTESGCNVYAYYVFQNVLNITRFSQSSMDADIKQWVKGGKISYGGQIAVISYVMFLNTYGLDKWRDMSQFYYNNPTEVQGDKLDVFAYVMAKVTGNNVCPYFDFFTYPLTKRTLDYCKGLPDMPDLLIDKY